MLVSRHHRGIIINTPLIGVVEAPAAVIVVTPPGAPLSATYVVPAESTATPSGENTPDVIVRIRVPLGPLGLNIGTLPALKSAT